LDMLRRMILMFWLVVIAISVFGQEGKHVVPDYIEIEKLTKDKTSAFHYEGMYKRYADNDATLTLRDYRMLYYGYFFRPEYTPFHHTAEADSIKMLLGTKEELNIADWKEVSRLGIANIE